VSHQVLQRVSVLMLYGALDVDAVIAAPRAALAALPDLAGLPLSEAELGWLAAADPRAFRTDPYRRARLLRALLEEYPVSAALSLGEPRALEAFFSSRHFRGVVLGRGSSALAFGDWLLSPLDRRPDFGYAHPGRDAVEGRTPRDACALLERAVARARRASAPSLPAGHVAPSPAAPLATLPAGTAALYARVRQHLGPAPVTALLTSGYRFPHATPLAAGTELALITISDGQAVVEEPQEWLEALMTRAAGPREGWLAAARELGAEPGEDADLIDDLIAQGLLIT